MKKMISIVAISALLVSTMSVSAFAYGGNRRGCGGAWYRGQTGWQSNYEICTVEGCEEFGLHEHDGTYYYCAYRGTGYGCGGGRWR